jgi:hypothetical protein
MRKQRTKPGMTQAELNASITRSIMQTPIMWPIRRPVRMGIKCEGRFGECANLARYGRTLSGGAPYSYYCSKCVPTGPIQMCRTREEQNAAIEQRNEIHRRFCRSRTCDCKQG